MITTRILHTLLPLAIVTVAAVGCTADDKRELGEQDIRDSLQASADRVLDERSTSADGALRCTARISTDGVATGSCSGTTADGVPFVVRYDGTADIDAETCTATMAVTIDGVAQADRAGVDCFAG